MNKVIAVGVLLLALVCASSEAARYSRRSNAYLVPVSPTDNVTMVSDRFYNFSTPCDAVLGCPQTTLYLELPSVTFQPSTRNAELQMMLISTQCAGQSAACPDFDKETGMRLIMTDVQGKVYLNFSVFHPGKLSNQHTARNLQVGQKYTVTIYAPTVIDPDYSLAAFQGKVRAIYATEPAVWVYVIIVAGGMLVLFLVIAIVWLLIRRCSARKDGYESFD